MINTLRWSGAWALGLGLVAMSLASGSGQDDQTPRPRPGLTAQQTKQAVKLAQGAMVELRKKTEGASTPGADLREYVVGVELLARKDAARPAGKESAPPAGSEPAPTKPAEQAKELGAGTLAIVTSYRYFDDMTVFSTIDVGTGRVVKVEAAQHLRTPLSEPEFDEAKKMARDKSGEVKQLYERFGDQLNVYPQFSQFTLKDDPRVHRVVHLTYRVGKRDLSYPRPEIDLTSRQVETPAPAEPEPRAWRGRRSQ